MASNNIRSITSRLKAGIRRLSVIRHQNASGTRRPALRIMSGLLLSVLIACAVFTACSVQYKLNAASINYDLTKTIQFGDFPLRSAYVWAPMHSMFNNTLQDLFARQTKLRQVKRNGDLQLSGEIIEYSQFNKSVSASGYSAQVQLRMTVNVRFVNTKKHEEDFERKFTATTEYDSRQQLQAVQETLVQEMIDDITDQIYNATVANW